MNDFVRVLKITALFLLSCGLRTGIYSLYGEKFVINRLQLLSVLINSRRLLCMALVLMGEWRTLLFVV